MKFDFSSLAVPVIQAPMAGGPNTPAMAAAAANGGGVGSFGFAYAAGQKISEDLLATRALTRGPINANFFIFQAVELPDQAVQQAVIQSLSNLPLGGEYALTIPEAPYFPELNAQLEPIWEIRPEILTFHFGIPEASVMARARASGIAVGLTATNADEAARIEKAGADFIVAQGIEAGGHRGVFDVAAADAELPTATLTALLSKQCSIPVVAAGGIMNGAQIAGMLKLGAAAAQMGTAFLCCDEAGTSDIYKKYLLHEQDRAAVITRSFSGRPARGINNRFIELTKAAPYLPFPLQNSLTRPLRQLAGQLGCGEFQSLWAGSAFAQSRRMATADFMKTLAEELLG